MCKSLRLLLFVSTFTLACVGQTAAPAESWPDRVQVKAKVQQVKGEAGASEALEIALEAREGWSINTAYPGLKVELSEKVPTAVRLLKKAAARFEDEKHGDKAARAVFRTDLTGAVPAKIEGTFKTVICNEATCSPPFTGSFSTASGAALAPKAG